MLIVSILIGLLLVLLLALLFTPFIVRVNTRQNQYQLRWGIARVQFIPEKDDGIIALQLAFWRRDFSLLQLLAKTPAKKAVQPQKSNAHKKGVGRLSFYRLRKVLQSFRIPYVYLDLDSNDFVTNAYWYPVCRALSTPTRQLRINFGGHNQCAFELRNRAVDVLIALIF
ncbi:MAG: hypothetical protein SFV55_01145 [Haliscomenobacter sp.]|uniref:hypothetical protein n=1 Tax=Haliscomenobacter sp. TaxID=2717303 RepID=UPI0029B3281F|nr:hypothetical protein [Haliscomenobacter sp.]MDX2066994.1 hypothetical protein [Haliscomenobacter sp.]